MASPGEVLADRWRLVEKIDAGAMGEIYRGAHQLLGHAVAIKILLPQMARDKGAVARFLKEARIAATLSHHNVVRVEDYGVSEDGRPFLVMELLRGESLARRLERSPRVPPREVLEILRQIAAALDVAHAAGIVHRDLKPENIFLVQAPEAGGALRVKVLDFGVAKFTDTLSCGAGATASNTLVGTPRYMSPEQARSSRELDGRSDLWSLGMLAYEMLTGRHPFDGEAIAELLVAILTHRIAPPSAVEPSLNPAVDDWMAQALARNRVERFPTGAAMVAALAESLDGVTERRRGGTPARTSAVGRRDERRATVRVQRPIGVPKLPEEHPEPPPDSASAVTPGASLEPIAPTPVTPPDDTSRLSVEIPLKRSTPPGATRSTRIRTLAGVFAVVALVAGLSVAEKTLGRPVTPPGSTPSALSSVLAAGVVAPSPTPPEAPTPRTPPRALPEIHPENVTPTPAPVALPSPTSEALTRDSDAGLSSRDHGRDRDRERASRGRGRHGRPAPVEDRAPEHARPGGTEYDPHSI
ncbi:MAG: protein kinase [Deltaproteobacteria bacterium]|nr:protein kinase [Deltaproteobacteria bacterium]